MSKLRRGLASLIALVAPAVVCAQGYTIATAAGGATPYYLPGTGDGGKATGAGLANPCYDVAVDGAGNLYIAAGTLIRKVTPAGIISTVAGGGKSLGDYIQATEAELSPTALAVDSAGNLFVADSGFGISRIRKVDTKGLITTVAGGAQCCALGDGGSALSAYISTPWGLAVDTSGNLYIAQVDGSHNNLIRKVSAAGTISTVAGGGAAGGDGGPATSAALARPLGVTADAAGNLYIAEAGANRVRKVSKSGIIATVATIDNPWHVAVDASGNLFVTQSSGATVRSVPATGGTVAVAGTGTHGFSGDGGPALSAQLDRPAGIAIGPKGEIYVADATSAIARVRLLTPAAPLTTPPAIRTAVSAGAFGAFAAIAPGSWIEIYGTNLATASRSWTGADFNGLNAPTALDGTKVTIGGQPAFIDYIGPTQINAQVASTTPTGSQAVVVTTAAGTSAAYTITVNRQQPGLLAPSSFAVGDKQYVVALFADGATFVLPPGAIAGIPSRRAKPGDSITLYGVGFGAVTPDIPAGQVVQQTNSLANTLHVLFGSTEAAVGYAGLAPNAVGLYQFNVTVPNVQGGDSVPLTLTLGGAPGTQALYIAVQN